MIWAPIIFLHSKKLHTVEFGPVRLSKAHIPVSMTQEKGYRAFSTFPDFSNVSHLTKLDLCFNTFVSIPEEYIYGLDSLDLYACYGELEVVPDVSHLKSLVKLALFSNSESIIPRNSIDGLKFITHFQFSNNKIKVMCRTYRTCHH